MKFQFFLRLVLIQIVLVCSAISAFAYDKEYRGCFKSVTVEYQSVNEKNQPCTLSERLTLPLNKDKSTARAISFVVLNSPSMAFTNAQAPSGEASINMGIIARIATEGAMVVEPDLKGFGKDVGHSEGLLMHTLLARQMVDGFFAAIDYVQKNSISLAEDYYTLNTGYSKGGSLAIAVQKHIENYCTPEQRNIIKLQRTICGGGPLVPVLLFDILIKQQATASPITAINLVHGALDVYGESTLRAYKETDIFTPDFLASGYLNSLDGRTVDSMQQEDILKELMGKTELHLSDVFLPKVLDGKSGPYRALRKVFKKESVIEGWIPLTPIEVFHLVDDQTIPYACLQEAKAVWGDKIVELNTDMKSYDWNSTAIDLVLNTILDNVSLDNHLIGGFKYFGALMDGCLRGTYIPTTYLPVDQYQDLIEIIYDVFSSAAYQNLPLDIDSGDGTISGILNVTTPLKARFVGAGKNGSDIESIDATISIKPSAGTSGENNDHLIIAVDNFDVSLLGSKPMRVSGEVKDVFHLLEALLPYLFKHVYSNKSEASAVVEKINNLLTLNAKVDALEILGKTVTIDGRFLANLDSHTSVSGWSLKTTYTIDLAVKSGIITVSLMDLLDAVGVKFPDDHYNVKIDNTHQAVINDIKMEEDRISAHCDVTLNEGAGDVDFADMDVVVTPAAISGYPSLLETVKIDFTGSYVGTTEKLVGTCSNLHDAALAVIVAGGNKHFKSESEAQVYADKINNKVEAHYTVDGVDQGPIQAYVRYDSTYNNYYVDFESSFKLESK